MFTLKFKTNNSAFDDNYKIPEIQRILENINSRLNNIDSSESVDWIIYDINGNKIGNLYIEESE